MTIVTERHFEENSADIFYMIRGKARFFIENVDAIVLEPGIFVCVPPKTPHGIYDGEEESLALVTWSPAPV
jgi:quercetin dioxygenase-like cupin family protein